MRGVIIAPVVALAMGLASCADLGAVHGISSQLGAAARGWDDVSDELAFSCRRTRPFVPALDRCAPQVEAGTAIRAIDRILVDYFDALAAAADGRTLTAEPGIAALGGAVARVPGIRTDQVRAATDLAGLLARLGTSALRERVLHDLIGGGAPAARTLIGALRATVPPAVETSLGAEEAGMGARFAIYIAQNGGSTDPDPAAMCAAGPEAQRFDGAAFLLALEYCRRLRVIGDHRAALASYVASLDRADAALRELQSGRTRLHGRALAEQLFGLDRALEDDVGAVRRAFGPGG